MMQHCIQLLLPAKVYQAFEQNYRNIEYEALRILHGLKTFHHYCFAKEVCIMTDHNALVAILSKDVATLPQQL